MARHIGHREGNLVGSRADFSAVFPYIFRRRCDSQDYVGFALDLEPFLAYKESLKTQGRKLSFFEFITAAVVQLLRERPGLNRFVKGRRIYQRDDVIISTIARRSFEDSGRETSLILHMKPDDSLDTILGKLRGNIKTVKESSDDTTKAEKDFFGTLMKLPRWAMRLFVRILEWMDFYKGVPEAIVQVDPTRCSVFLANLGSIGLDAIYHRLYEWGTASLFVCIGTIGPQVAVLPDRTVGVKTMVNIKITLDENITDGVYAVHSFKLLQSYFADPAGLVERMGGIKKN
jgi:hypothetical protein